MAARPSSRTSCCWRGSCSSRTGPTPYDDSQPPMNKQISRVALVALLLLASLIVATTYWQGWAAGSLAAKEDNSIQRVAQFRIKRGLILASDGKTVFAANTVHKVQGQSLYFRRYRPG